MGSLVLRASPPDFREVMVDGTVDGTPFRIGATGNHVYPDMNVPAASAGKAYEGEVTDPIVVTSSTCAP